MAWILVKVSPKISSHSAGWTARVYSSVRSWRILRISTQQSVTTRLARRRTPARGGSAGSPGHPGGRGSAEAASGAPGAADVTDASLLGIVVQRPAGVMTEHVVKGGSLTQSGLELGRGAGGAEGAVVHERDPVAVQVGLIHVVGGHEDGRLARLPEPGDELPDVSPGDRVQPHRRLVKHQQPWRVDQRLGQLEPPDHAAGVR